MGEKLSNKQEVTDPGEGTLVLIDPVLGIRRIKPENIGAGGPSGGVTSFNNRTGAITPEAGDYSIPDITGLPEALAGKFDTPAGSTTELVRGDGTLASIANTVRIVDAQFTVGQATDTTLAAATPISIPAAIGALQGQLNVIKESGVFTPSVFGITTAGSPTYPTRIGRYQRIGGRCYFSIRISISNKGGMAGTIRVGGLPFVVAANGGASMSVVSSNLALAEIHPLNAYTIAGSTNIEFSLLNATGASSFLNANTISDTFTVWLSGHYEV